MSSKCLSSLVSHHPNGAKQVFLIAKALQDGTTSPHTSYITNTEKGNTHTHRRRQNAPSSYNHPQSTYTLSKQPQQKQEPQATLGTHTSLSSSPFSPTGQGVALDLLPSPLLRQRVAALLDSVTYTPPPPPSKKSSKRAKEIKAPALMADLQGMSLSTTYRLLPPHESSPLPHPLLQALLRAVDKLLGPLPGKFDSKGGEGYGYASWCKMGC